MRLSLVRTRAQWHKEVGGGTTESTVDLEELASLLNNRLRKRLGGSNQRLAIMLGIYRKDKTIQANIPEKDRSNYSLERYKYLLESPFDISNKCCNVMKKAPAHSYTARTKRYFITGQMASESKLRTQKWLENGCNGFDLDFPVSNPMSFWTEQDVLLYIRENNISICKVYGEVITEDEAIGQGNLADFGLFDLERPALTTTGCKRTGCMLCGFGCHLEKPGEGRFELLKKTHPKMYAMLDVVQNNGWTMRQAIEWMNEHGNLNIRL